MIYIESKKRKLDNIRKQYPNARILDVTSSADEEKYRMLSPFYPHYNIPIPFTPESGLTATCVEAVWQGLKVFQNQGVSIATFKNDTMKNLKRTVRKLGKPLGHQKGVHSTELLNYYDARMLIYLPTYKWVLDNVPSVHETVMQIKEESQIGDVVLLDYNTNEDVQDTSKPLSHAGLLKLYIEDKYPNPTDAHYQQQPKQQTNSVTKDRKKNITKKSDNNNELKLF